MKKATAIFAVALMLMATAATAQETQSTINQENSAKSGNTKFLMSGYGFTGMEVEGNKKISFGETGFNPIFIWKHSDKLFIESELEVELEDGETEIALEYFDIQYTLNKYMTLRAGKFLSPFGTFSERLHPSWINKSPSKPLGFGMMDAVGPGNEMGLDLRGGFQLGKSKMNYSLYASNGPTFNDGSDNPMMAGILNYNKNFSDNNKNKALGGRLGFLPFSNSSLEIGFSGQSAKVGKADKMLNNMIDTTLEDVNALMYAVDLSFVKSISSLKSIIDIKGQLNSVTTDKAEFKDPMDTTGTMTYTFNNVSQAYYIQFAFRPALVENKFFKNIEVVARYASLNLPEKAQWGGEKSQLTLGLNFWLSWRSAIKFAYETNTEDRKAEEPRYLFQWAIAF